MGSSKREKRTFQGMGYREVQRANSTQRSQLRSEDQKWLKAEGYRNFGWKQVIKLYEKIEEILDKYRYEDWSLEDLYLEVNRIGNKYLSNEEISDVQQKIVQELNEISDLINQQFPDTENEEIDFSQPTPSRSRKTR